nr:restriction endonuclease subunit S [Bifidobacterium pullorum]
MPAWEQRKLGELFSYGGSGGTPSSSNDSFYGGKIPFLGISDVKGRDISHTAKHITENGLAASAAWVVPSGAVCLAMYASVGKVGIIRQNTATSQAFFNMVFDNDGTRDFVYSRLERAELTTEWESLISTGTQRNLNANKVRDFMLAVPAETEQRLIGSLFARLDSLITLHQRKHNNTDIEHATGEMRESTQMMSTPVSGSVYEPTDSDIDPYLAFYLSPTLGATHQLLNGDVTPHILVGILAEFHGNVCAVQLTGMNDLRHRPFVAHDIPPPSGTIRIPTPE